MKFCIFTPTPQREKLGGFWVANFLSYFPKENRLKICHSPNLRKCHHIVHGKERNLSPGTRSGGDFTCFVRVLKPLFYNSYEGDADAPEMELPE